MKRALILVLLLAAAGGGAWWYLHRDQAADGDKAEAEVKAVAQVEMAPLKKGMIEKTLVAYGTAVAPAGGTRSISFPLECRIGAVQVNPGQEVAVGDDLLKVDLSPDSQVALETARGAKAAADRLLVDVEHRIQARLATNQDLVSAQTAAKDAATKLASMEKGAPAADGFVKAPVAGIVTKTPAQPGMVIPAGGSLVEIAVENRLEAQLGVPPPDAGEIKEGQAVRLYPVEPGSGGAGGAATGKIRFVGQSVDPATQLVNAFALLDVPGGDDQRILMGSYLRAEIVVDKKEALLAPRAAIVPGEDGKTGEIFTMENGKAVKRDVDLGLDDGTNVEVSGSGNWLAPGTPVVTVGAPELEDGTPVTTGTEAGKEPEAKEP